MIEDIRPPSSFPRKSARKKWRLPRLPKKLPKFAPPADWKRIALVLIAVLIVVLGYHVLRPGTSVLPADIRQQLTFSPFVLPNGSKDFTASGYKLAKAEDGTQIFSYVIRAQNGATVSVSQYTQPPQFTEIAEYKDRFLTNVIQQHDTVQTANGIIYLGKLTKDNNRPLGVMLERGLIVFMSPDKDLSKTQWHSLGDQLDIQKVVN